MDNEGGGYFLARVLIAIFGKERLSCAYVAFVGIIALILAVVFLQAESIDDIVFPIIALTFILAYVLFDGYRAIRHGSVSDFQAPKTGIYSGETFSIESKEAVEREPSSVSVTPKTPSYFGTYIAGGLLAAGLMLPMMCAGMFVFEMMLPIHLESADALAFATIQLLISCALLPFAALIGAVVTKFAVRSARRHSPDANLTRPFLIIGAVVAIVVSLIGIAIFYYLICIDGQACGF